MRDYGTALWEGGDAGCDHLTTRERSSNKSTLAGYTSEDVKMRAESVLVPSAECGKCGARRIDSQLGLEPTPDQYVQNLVEVFREVRRVLRDDGTVWLNLGDSYNSIGHKKSGSGYGTTGLAGGKAQEHHPLRRENSAPGLKHKDLVGIPWRVAFALQADGWYLRSDIIWAKPNPMPESVRDRPTRSHEYIFLLSKSSKYFFDQEAVKEPAIRAGEEITLGPKSLSKGQATGIGKTYAQAGGNAMADSVIVAAGRNIRSVWNVATQPYKEAHFATFPEKLVEPCIVAGSSPKACGECGAPWERVVERSVQPPDYRPTNKPIRHLAASAAGQGTHGTGDSTLGMVGDTQTTGWQPTCGHFGSDDGPTPTSGHPLTTSLVLDPFCGSGTVGVVALRHGRSFIGLELNPSYCQMAAHRISDDAPLLNVVEYAA